MKILRKIASTSILLALVVSFGGCEKMSAPNAPRDSIQGKIKKPVLAESHWEASELIKYKSGGKLKIDKLYSLQVWKNSMDTGVDTEIFGEVDLLFDESLKFHFEPAGLHFEPNAELTLKWDKLNLGEYETLYLYYIESSGKKVLVSDSNDDSGHYKWDKIQKTVRFPISHFSLYSLSRD